MIELTKPSDYLGDSSCLSCGSKDDILSLRISRHPSQTSVTDLCRVCRTALKTEISLVDGDSK